MAVDIEHILNRHKELQAEKTLWNNHYQILGEYIRIRKQNFTANTVPGEFLVDDIFDSTGPLCNVKMAAAFMGAQWPNGAKSMNIVAPHGVPDSPDIKNYFKEVTIRLADAMDSPKSGLVLALDEYGQDQGCFGTCGVAVFEEDDLDHPLSYKVWDVKTMCIDEDNRGVVDTVYNEMKMTVRKVVQEYGIKNVSPKVKELYDKKKYSDEVCVLHVIEPRLQRNPKKKNNKNMPIASIHIDLKNKFVMKESGFEEMPVIVARFSKVPEEKYGRSPSMLALPDILELNAIRESRMLATEKNLDPPLMVYDDGSMGGGVIDSSSGSVNVVSIAGRVSNQKPVEPLYTVGEMQSTQLHIEELKETVTQQYYLDRLLDLNNETRMTLGEAQIRNKLRGDSLSAIFSRQELEFFTPLIERSFNVMFNKGLLGVEKGSMEEAMAIAAGEKPLIIPDAILKRIKNGRESYLIQYMSPAKRMMQAEEAQGIMTTWEFAGNLAAAVPEIVDHLDPDASIKRLAELTGAPSAIIRDLTSVKMMRQARAQMQAQMAELEALRSGSESARNFAQAENTGE